MDSRHPALKAIQSFWQMRDEAAARQGTNGKEDTGGRKSVTAGKHMRDLEEIIIDEFIDGGIPRSSIRQSSGIELPGYYRPAKKWDIVVLHRGILVAAIEFKSQVGPSFGNNVNNRTEEAIGSAVDVWRAYEEGTFGKIKPWLGYFFLLESCAKSTSPVKLPKTVFPVEDVFNGSSYKDRYQILCQRLTRERLYDATCFLTSTRGPDTTIEEPDPEVGFSNFAAAIAGRIAYVNSLPEMHSSPDEQTQGTLL